MSQDLNTNTCSCLVIFMYWAHENHTFNATSTEWFQQLPFIFAMNRTYCTFFFVKVAPVTTFTPWSKNHFVVIGKAEKHVRKASHCCTQQQWRSHVVLILFLLVRVTCVLFIMHIPFVVNRTFNTMLTERLQHLQQGWARLLEMTESERDN